MHSVIVVVGLPDDDRPWEAFIARAKVSEQMPYVHRLATNVWQVNVQENLSALSKILGAADGLGLFYKILSFDDEPQWIAGNLVRKAT